MITLMTLMIRVKAPTLWFPDYQSQDIMLAKIKPTMMTMTTLMIETQS